MNTEAIIEQLLLIEDEQILNTPLDELDLPTRVYRPLWRSQVRTIRDLALSWSQTRKMRNVGERARAEILGALQAWSISIPDFITSQGTTSVREAAVGRPPRSIDGEMPGCDARQAVRTPIEVLHLSPRAYAALKRNKIDTVADIYRAWDKITSLRNMGPKTIDQLHKAVESFYPKHGSQPARNGLADGTPAADAVGDETMDQVPTKKHVITESGVIVSTELLQAEEPRRSRAERWKIVAPRSQDYAPKNTFQAIGKGQDKIFGPITTSPIQRGKKTPDGSGRKYTSLLSKLLETLEKANRPRKVRNVTCPLCRAVMKSIQFEEHLVDMHPQAFQELQNAVSGSLGWQNVPGVGLVFREPRETNHIVKCPLCEHRDRYRVMNIHIQVRHPEVDPGLMISRFHKVNRSKDYENLLKYKEELNELIKEYERLKRAQDEHQDGSYRVSR